MPGPYDTATGTVVGFGVVVVVVVVVGVVVEVVVVDVEVVVGSEKSVDRYNHVQYLSTCYKCNSTVSKLYPNCFFIIFLFYKEKKYMIKIIINF